MDVFGSFALILAFVCALYAFVGGIAAIITRHPLLIKSARQAGIAVCGLIFTATLSLVYLFFTDNYSVAYVVSHSNRDLSTFFKIAALWSGQEGSLLFWSFLLAIYVVSVLLTYRNKNGELMPYVGVILAGVQLFFLTISNFVASPFKALGVANAAGSFDLVARADGNGLNPVLQYPEMVIHPPNLYSGYTGFTIPFAFALGALLARYPGEKWIHLTRKWAMIAWMFQSMGILLGAHWAYAVLGWGGYWGWDPVENASLLPWLTGTAFLHSVMMQEKRGMMKVWNVWLVFLTFMLCILGTLLTRSGVVSSVHSFAQSSIGNWFVGFLLIILGVREMFALICFSLCVFVATTIVQEFYRGARVVRARSSASWLASCVDLTLRNTRRYGGYIVHLGMVMIFIGLAGQAFNKEVEKELPIGSTISIGKYELLLQSMDRKQERNYVADRMIVEVMTDKKPVMMLNPERRNFPANQESGTMVAIYSTLRADLYVVYAGMNPQNNLPTIHVFINPLVKWVWWGGMVVVMGTIVALVPTRAAVVVLARTEVPSATRELSGIRPAQVTLREGHD